jgi:ATP-dependent helicase/nuclease subunit A
VRPLSVEIPPSPTFTAEQEQAAARRRGPLLLAAGAGSGKTAVLVERFVRAVREDGIAPGRILAITFTERAAAELRERVRARLLALGEREAARDTEGAPIGTFHGFCARLLRVHALTAGLDPDFAILDETGAGRLRALAFRRALAVLLADERRQDAVELLAAYGADRVQRMVVGVYAEQRSRGVSRPALPDARLSASTLVESPASQPQLQPTLFEIEPLPSARGRGALHPAEPASSQSGLTAPNPREPEGPDPLELEALRACALLGEILAEFAGGYEALKQARPSPSGYVPTLDFDDLELRARDLLERHEGVRRGWSERIELLMVDEFQDTNRRQLALLELLERDNLFTVGDELQSIYGFRHAEVEIFRERHRRLHAEGATIALAHNFRSRSPLISAINGLFAERFGETYTPLIAAREGHTESAPAPVADGPVADDSAAGGSVADDSAAGGSVANGPAAGEYERGITAGTDIPLIELLLTDKSGWAESPYAQRIAGALPPATLWRQAEARLLAQRIAELVAGGHAAAGDVAVLLRAATDLPVYEGALEERGLRTLAAVGSFWGHQQVGDLLAWLRAIANPLDELALYSVLASPLVGISSDGLALVALQARAEGVGAWAAIARAAGQAVAAGRGGMNEHDIGGAATQIRDAEGAGKGATGEAVVEGLLYHRLSATDRERLERFAERFAVERGAAPTRSPAELLLRAIAHSGYEPHVLSLPWGERRLANIHKLLRLARRFEAAEGRDLRGFLDHVAQRRAHAESSEPHAPMGSEPDAVRLMTIHAAKGLEFPVVCLADLGRIGNGTSPDLLVDGERVGLRLAGLDGSAAVPCLRYEELSEERRRGESAEEERILYVAMTRARERLLLSGACDFARWSGGAPITWLAPALAPELSALLSTLEHPVADLPVVGGDGDVARCWLNSPVTVGRVLRDPHATAAMSRARSQPPLR